MPWAFTLILTAVAATEVPTSIDELDAFLKKGFRVIFQFAQHYGLSFSSDLRQ